MLTMDPTSVFACCCRVSCFFCPSFVTSSFPGETNNSDDRAGQSYDKQDSSQRQCLDDRLHGCPFVFLAKQLELVGRCAADIGRIVFREGDDELSCGQHSGAHSSLGNLGAGTTDAGICTDRHCAGPREVTRHATFCKRSLTVTNPASPLTRPSGPGIPGAEIGVAGTRRGGDMPIRNGLGAGVVTDRGPPSGLDHCDRTLIKATLPMTVRNKALNDSSCLAKGLTARIR